MKMYNNNKNFKHSNKRHNNSDSHKNLFSIKKSAHKFKNKSANKSASTLTSKSINKLTIKSAGKLKNKSAHNLTGKSASKPKRGENFAVGILSVNVKGFGFVKVSRTHNDSDITDVFIPANNMNGALNGDKVRVKVVPPRFSYESSDKYEGYIVEVLERAVTKVVGTYRINGTNPFVEADDTHITRPIYIKNFADFSDLKSGAKVVADITGYPTNFYPMTGIITEVLGNKNDVGVDILAIMRRYNVVEEFPKEVAAEAARIETAPTADEIANRVNRTDFQIVTIDGLDAKDLDDAVYARKNKDGSFFLGVYIADVSYYVKEKSPLDIEAFERGTSIYLVDRVIPMLPKELSNGICSLNAGVNRLAFACEMNLDSSANVVNYNIFPTVINVCQRLNYTAVNSYFNNGDVSDMKAVTPMLEILKDICEKRLIIRKNRGSIDFDLPEIKVRLDERGKPVEIIKRERNLAESIIEECMLLANETVAKHMFKQSKPFIYRVHEQPDDEKLDSFNDLLSTFNLHINRQPNGKIQPIDIQRVLKKIAGKPEEKIISTIALRSMKQARYSVENTGHFGLAARYYTHFTSPIRRYPDLIVHRLLRELINPTNKSQQKKHNIKLRNKLPKIATQSSNLERLAIDIERETTELKITEYMKAFVGKNFDAVICSVTKFGFFVELDNGVDGLVRIESLTGDFFNYVESEYAIFGRRTGKKFKIGDNVKVKLVEANIELRQLTFIFIKKFLEADNIIVDS